MGRNPAFGRPQARDQLRIWWEARSESFRTNGLLAIAVGAVAVAIVFLATSRDASRLSPLANSTRPLTTGSIPFSPSTVLVPGLAAAGESVTPEQDTTTTSTTVAVPATVPPPARSAPAVVTTATTTATTTPAPAPATTVPNPNVVYTDVPLPPTSSTTPGVPRTTAITLPPTTAPSTTSSTSTTALSLPVPPLPRLLPG